MIVKEVIKKYGNNWRYFVYDAYEDAYYDRTNEGKWFDAFNRNDENFDEDEVITIKEFVEEEIIIITVDTSSR